MNDKQDQLIDLVIFYLKKITIDDLVNARNLSTTIKKYLSKNIIDFENYCSNHKISIRVIRTNSNNQVKESVPFSPVSLFDLLFEEWESENRYEKSKLSAALENIYLFVVFNQKTESSFFLEKLVVWECSEDELEIIKSEYNLAKSIVKKGVIINDRIKGGKIISENNLLKSSKTQIIHMRPHAINKDDIDLKYFKYTNGITRITKQSFWLNSKYINYILNSKWQINLKEE
jgi:DNA mismatch repair protein MutH